MSLVSSEDVPSKPTFQDSPVFFTTPPLEPVKPVTLVTVLSTENVSKTHAQPVNTKSMVNALLTPPDVTPTMISADAPSAQLDSTSTRESANEPH